MCIKHRYIIYFDTTYIFLHSLDQNVRLAVRSIFVWHLQYFYSWKKNSKGDNHFLPSFVLDPPHDKISLTLSLSSLFCGWLSFDYAVLGECRLNHFLTTAKNMGIPNLFLTHVSIIICNFFFFEILRALKWVKSERKWWRKNNIIEWVKFPGKIKKDGVIIPDDNITW